MLAASKFNKTWPSIVFSKPFSRLSESAIILVSMAMGMGETLHPLPEMQSFFIKRRAFRLVPPDGVLLVLSAG